MVDLSPATAAVLDAYRSSHLSLNNLAAALRNVAIRINGADNIRQDILDIADELENL